MPILSQQVYDYIKEDNISKVEEYLQQINNQVNNITYLKLKSFIMYAVDWKRLEIIKLLIKYSASPQAMNNFAMYYATTRTNGLPSLEIIAYLNFNQTLEEYVGGSSSTCNQCGTANCNCK